MGSAARSCLLLFAVSALVYANSLGGAFLWDDQFIIVENTHIRNPSRAPQLFKETLRDGVGRTGPFYRPLQALTHMADYRLWRLDPRGHHATNLLLHALAVLALWTWLRALTSDPTASVFGALLWAVHPVHTEAVAYVSGRADMLMAIFFFLAFTLYLKRRWALSVAAFILALMSKEAALFFPLTVLLYHLVLRLRPWWRCIAAYGTVAAGYAALRLWGLPIYASDDLTVADPTQRLAGFFDALAGYARLLVAPHSLHMEYAFGKFSLGDPGVIAGAVLVLAAAAAVWRWRRTYPLAAFGIAWYALNLLPVSNLFPINARMAEHWLYLPSAGIALAVGLGLAKAYRSPGGRVPVLAFVILTSAALSVLTLRQNLAWADPVAFFERTLRYSPMSYKAHQNLGYHYQMRGRLDEAVNEFNAALKINPDYTAALNSLGNIYRRRGRVDRAMQLHEKAIRLRPHDARAYFSLGNAYHDLKRYGTALEYYQKALELDPSRKDTLFNLANELLVLNRPGEAAEYYGRVLSIDPQDAEARRNLALARDMLEQNRPR